MAEASASPDATDAPDREVLTWQGFGDASRELATRIVDSGWVPDLIVAIARGGLIPAGAIAYAMDVKAMGTMNVEFYSASGRPWPSRCCCPRSWTCRRWTASACSWSTTSPTRGRR